MSTGEWIMMGLFFANACALYLVALHATRVQDNQSWIRDEYDAAPCGADASGEHCAPGPLA